MKYLLDFTLTDIHTTGAGDAMLRLTPVDPVRGANALAQVSAGQFVNIHVPQSHSTFLRRPISICDVCTDTLTLTLFVKDAGAATHTLCNANSGEQFNILLPLGNGFSFDSSIKSPLLVAGGVGIAPMLFLAKQMKKVGITPTMLLGAVSADRLILTEKLSELGEVNIATNDGSAGERGLVTEHSALQRQWDSIYCCGPLPMMKAVAGEALKKEISCQVSLENVMACGLGACLCCVEDTRHGNVCVCKEGPVFNIKELKWQTM